MTYAIDEFTKIIINELENGGYSVEMWQECGGRWTRLDEEQWAKLEDIKWFYGID